MRIPIAWSRVISCVVFAIVLTVPLYVVAQPSLTETYTSSDGLLTMNYPQGWDVTEDDNGIVNFIAPDRSSLRISVDEFPLDTTPIDLLTAGDFGFSEAEYAELGGYAALLSRSSDQLQAIVNLCDGRLAIVFAFTQSGQVAANEPTFRAMLDSIRYGDEQPRICRGAFEGFAVISPANAASLAPVGALGPETLAVNAVAISPNNRLLAIGSSARDVLIFNLVTGQPEAPVGSHAGGAASLAFEKVSTGLVTGSGIGVVQSFEVPSGSVLGQYQRHTGVVESIAYSPVDLTVVSGGADGTVRVWNRGRASEQTPLDEDSDTTPITSIAYSPDGTLVAAAGGSSIRLWDFPAGTLRSTLAAEFSGIAAIAFSPDGTQLVYGGESGDAWIWDLDSGNRALLSGHDAPLTALTISPDGRTIATGDQTSVRLWDAANGEQLAAFESPSAQPVASLAFSANGTLLAVGGTGPVTLLATTEVGAVEPTTETESDQPASTATAAGTTSAATCSVSAPGSANLRAGPGTNFDRAGALSGGQAIEIDGQAQGSDGFAWYRLTDGAWVRGDVIGSPPACAGVPAVTP